MNILIINAHWYNRGDEAALRAMIDELLIAYPEANIKVHIIGGSEFFPYVGQVKLCEGACPAGRRVRWIDFWIRLISKGRLGFKMESKQFFDSIMEADLILHGPGGPAIGDIYVEHEFEYLSRFLFVMRAKKPYAFYAPSMGPFIKNKNHFFRKKILNGAQFIAVREPLSAKYLANYALNKDIIVTLDSAFQHSVDKDKYYNQFINDKELISFINKYKRIVGVTITDLMWNPQYANNIKIKNNIRETFEKVIFNLTNNGFGVLFIPQLFGKYSDADYMASFANQNCYVMPVNEMNDCYYQQFVIGKIYAVIGMRYHSNIFAAKMGTPFISISYEQKMDGFMTYSDLKEYCIDVNELSTTKLLDCFDTLTNKYEEYKLKLDSMKNDWKKQAYKTTELVIRLLKDLEKIYGF